MSSVEITLDPLTGVYSRSHLWKSLGDEAARSRGSERSFSIIVADLDHFKSVNDAFGHTAGSSARYDTSHGPPVQVRRRRIRHHLARHAGRGGGFGSATRRARSTGTLFSAGADRSHHKHRLGELPRGRANRRGALREGGPSTARGQTQRTGLCGSLRPGGSDGSCAAGHVSADRERATACRRWAIPRRRSQEEQGSPQRPWTCGIREVSVPGRG
jgi:hypothetical protein